MRIAVLAQVTSFRIYTRTAIHMQKWTFQLGTNADLLTRPHSTLFQGLSSLQFPLSAVQGTQVPQGGVHCRAGYRNDKHNDSFKGDACNSWIEQR